MEHGNGANFTGNESWHRGGLEAIFKLKKLFETGAQKAGETNVFATKIRVGHPRPGNLRAV